MQPCGQDGQRNSTLIESCLLLKMVQGQTKVELINCVKCHQTAGPGGEYIVMDLIRVSGPVNMVTFVTRGKKI